MSIRVRALIVFLVAAIVLAGLIATIVAFEAASDRSQVQADKTTSAIISTQTLLRILVDAETGVRGYIATGQPLFLQPYEDAVAETPASMQTLRSAADNGLLAPARAKGINQRAFGVLGALDHEVSMVAANHRDAALRDLNSGGEKRAMDAVRSAIGEQIAIWRADREKGAAALHRIRNVLYGITIAGSLAVIGGLLSSLWFFGFGLIRRIDTLSDNATRIALGEPLADQMPGTDELAGLDRALHAMSCVINERETALARFRLIFEAAHDAMTFIDVETGRVVEANPAACHLYGYEHQELIRLPIARLRAPEYREVLKKQLEDAFNGGVYTEAVAMRKDGSTFQMESTLHGTIIDGRPLVVSIIRDATERQQTRQHLLAALDDAVRASRLKSEFVAGISHEIRTPMNGVVGMTDLLLQTSLDEQQRDYAETIRDSADALLRIIGDILDFSKIEAGKVEIESAAFDLRRIVESTAQILGPNAARKPIGLMTFVDPRLPSLVTGDAGRLRQILLNIVGNAIKFTPHGCVTLSVEPTGNNQIRFSILDSGIGMDSETIERLFKPFTQADASTTRRYGGTGLGLSISQRLVELMGGTLEVTSQLGIGSRFWFTIPLPVVSEGDGVITLRGRRCAIVVADGPTRSMLQRYAQSWQMQYVAAESWSAAIFTGAFDIAIVDAAGRPMAEDRDVTRIITVVDGEASSSMLQGGTTIVRAPLTQSTLYEALDEAFATTRQALPVPNLDAPLELRVLVAEDNAVNQRVARKQLERLGCSVVIASTGREAVERFQDHLFDVILMDCHMPEMDGYTAAQRIRELEAGTERTPIIALTAGAMEEDRMRCIAAGMDDFLSKPIDLNALRTAVSRWAAKGTHA